MLAVSVLPASFGDCLWIEYGEEAAPNVILIDAGPGVPDALNNRLDALRSRGGCIELVVVTHVDADHIGGMLTLLENDFHGVPVRDLWFNGLRHLPGESFGEKQGERLTGLLLKKRYPWNVAFGGGAVVVDDERPDYPVVTLPGGAQIRLLSPDAAQLGKLRKNWIQVCGEADLYGDLAAAAEYFGELESFGSAQPDVDALADARFEEDDTVANGSSIAFEITYQSCRILCGADAYPSRLLRSLAAIRRSTRFHFDLVKLPHHGSANNVSIDFVAAMDCGRYVFSSSGARFKHPSGAAVARVVRHGASPRLIFNYRSPFTELWSNPLVQATHSYSVEYGDADGVTVKLM